MRSVYGAEHFHREIETQENKTVLFELESKHIIY